MGALGQLFHFIAVPLYYAISAILLVWHKAFSFVGSDWSWVLAIVGLTVTIRALLIPLFVKQIKSSRNMQLIQPKVKELQKKYGHDRERLAQETMKLYKETGTNPFASCLPLIIQMPIFLCLFRLVNSAAHGTSKVKLLSHADVEQISNAKLFGARLADTFNNSHDVHVKVLAAVLVVLMCATTFFTQRQLMSKNMPADAMTGQYAQQQKMLLYVLPFVFAISGIAFPIAAMLYWTTSNLWTMCQQFYVIRNNPSPGTPAFEAKKRRDAEKAARKGKAPESSQSSETAATTTVVEDQRPATRQQPKRQTRQQRRASGARPNESDGKKQ